MYKLVSGESVFLLIYISELVILYTNISRLVMEDLHERYYYQRTAGFYGNQSEQVRRHV